MKTCTYLIRIGVFVGMLVAGLLTGCNSPSGQATMNRAPSGQLAMNDSLLTNHPSDPGSYPFPQNTPAPGRW
jgi:hypothetical protein